MGKSIDGCWNCKFMERTGMARIMRCKKSGSIAIDNEICSYYKLNSPNKPKTKDNITDMAHGNHTWSGKLSEEESITKSLPGEDTLVTQSD